MTITFQIKKDTGRKAREREKTARKQRFFGFFTR